MTIRIIADEREKHSQVPNLLKQLGVFVDYNQLVVGDYIVSPETVIERKTIYDLINSVYDGRLFVQCSNLSSHYTKPLIIIEGNLTDLDNRERLEPGSKLLVDKIHVAYNSLIKIALDFRIPILYTPSVFYTAELLVELATKKLQDKNNGPLLKKIKKSNPFFIQQLYVLTSLPGIGSTLATRLLERFHTPRDVLNASIADLARVPGLGYARAEKIRKILDAPVSNDMGISNQTKLVVENDEKINENGNNNNNNI